MAPVLRLDWCSYEAAKYAVEHWHYSKRMSAGKNVCIGVWEDDDFVGVIVFGLGSGNATNGDRYGLATSHEMAELTRIALRNHYAPVSAIISIGVRMIRKQSSGLRLLISMADPLQGHIGGIYQAANWIYTGVTKPDVMYFSYGKWRHHRTATSKGSVKGLLFRKIPGKYRYLYPLDQKMRMVIEAMAKPYPKRLPNGGTS